MMFKKYLKLFALIAAVIPATINAQAAKLYIEDFSINPGETKTINIIMENPDIQVWQAQLDVRLPEGLSVTKDDGDLNIELLRNDNKNKHSLDANETEGVIRILVSTTSDKIIKGTDGAFIALEIVAADNFTSGVIKLESMKLVPFEGETVIPADSECQVNGTQPTTVSIKANDLTMVYGDDVPELTYTVTDGEALGTPELTCDVTSESPVGTYPIVITKGTLTNDVANLTNGTLTITKAPLTITAQSYTIQQGDAMPDFEVTYSGFKNNDTEAVLDPKPVINCAATSDSEPGDYAITVSDASAINYEISYVAGTLTINAKEPEIIIDDEGSSYVVEDDNTVSFTGNDSASGSFEIPSTVTTSDGETYTVNAIAQGAFENNTQVTEITIPETITAIGGSAFAGCVNLSSLTCLATTPPTIYEDALPAMRRASTVFAGIDKEKCILYVPEGCVSAYEEADGWKEFQNILVIGSSGISVISIDGKAGNVYDMSGRLIRENAITLEGLSKGVYIFNGRKVVKE